MISSKTKKIIYIALGAMVLIAAAVFLADAMLDRKIKDSLFRVWTVIRLICYVGALVFGVIGAMKWKAYGEKPDITPFNIPVTYWGIAVMLAIYPEFMSIGTS